MEKHQWFMPTTTSSVNGNSDESLKLAKSLDLREAPETAFAIKLMPTKLVITGIGEKTLKHAKDMLILSLVIGLTACLAYSIGRSRSPIAPTPPTLPPPVVDPPTVAKSTVPKGMSVVHYIPILMTEEGSEVVMGKPGYTIDIIDSSTGKIWRKGLSSLPDGSYKFTLPSGVKFKIYHAKLSEMTNSPKAFRDDEPGLSNSGRVAVEGEFSFTRRFHQNWPMVTKARYKPRRRK